MKSIVTLVAAILAACLFVFAMPANASSRTFTPCGSVRTIYSSQLPITHAASVTARVRATGQGTINLSADNGEPGGFWWRNVSVAGCPVQGCEVSIPSVQPGASHTLRVRVDVATQQCPAQGVTTERVHLKVGP